MTTRKRPGPKAGPNGNRVPLWGHGPKVDPETKLELDLWRDAYGIPYGRAIDRLLAHAREHPGFRIPTRGRKTYRQIPKTGPLKGPETPNGGQPLPEVPEPLKTQGNGLPDDFIGPAMP